MDAKYTIINYRANFGEKSHGNAKNNMKSLKQGIINTSPPLWLLKAFHPNNGWHQM